MADIEYETRMGEAASAVDAAGWPAPLVARLEALPTVKRGAMPARLDRMANAGEAIEFSARFEGGEPAMIYARSDTVEPLMLSVVAADERTVCRKHRRGGRAICRWSPLRDMTVKVRAVSTADKPSSRIRIFTN